MNMQDVRNRVNDLKGPELVNAYNTIAPKMDKPTVKKFTDLATGRKRVIALFDEYHEKGETKKVKAAKPAKKASGTLGVGKFITLRLETTNDTPAQIIEAVRERFPESKATARDVAWYKCKLKK